MNQGSSESRYLKFYAFISKDLHKKLEFKRMNFGVNSTIKDLNFETFNQSKFLIKIK